MTLLLIVIYIYIYVIISIYTVLKKYPIIENKNKKYVELMLSYMYTKKNVYVVLTFIYIICIYYIGT